MSALVIWRKQALTSAEVTARERGTRVQRLGSWQIGECTMTLRSKFWVLPYRTMEIEQLDLPPEASSLSLCQPTHVLLERPRNYIGKELCTFSNRLFLGA